MIAVTVIEVQRPHAWLPMPRMTEEDESMRWGGAETITG